MNKRYPALVLLCALLLPLLCGCSPSPTAVTVGNRRVDASEYAFYLNYNRLSTGEDSGTVLFDEEDNAIAREAALDQILTGEVVRLKCEEFGLELSDNQRQALQTAKEQLIESLGGKADYLNYLRQSCLTDRAYDKFQENDYYSALLYNYMMTDSESYYTDESLRQYFTTHYATVKYIFFSFLDEEGNKRDKEELQNILDLALTISKSSPGTDFDALMEQYNEDVTMTSGFPIGMLEAASTEHLATLFDLEENQVSQPIVQSDGCYVIKRCPISAGYYDENQREIFLAACNDRFEQSMAQWKTEYPVKVSAVVDDINLSNLTDYVK
ncbi:MAG: peptidylprolyl isomerase [Clostridia bacterium]|nr:peptidylprolyl isomerase [Clostridia bacterium]